MSRAQRAPIYTVGHSTRSIAEFVDLLKQGQVELVVDIRSTPRSRTNPQFNLDALPNALSAWQIGHTRIAELGGRRTRSKVIPPEVNDFWINQSFHNYADYALSDEFRAGFSRLIELANERRCAIMCSEAVWWRCHRRFVADYLIHDGWDVFHLMGVARVDVATLNPAARAEGASLVYPALDETSP
ncbi:MAG: repair protein [Hyphomicrobiales bacterium]|nr:repair protein [Hyphomicrobiales bacterium]